MRGINLYIHYSRYIIVVLLIILFNLYSSTGYSQFDDDKDEVELCGLPSNGWNFEQIISTSCTDINCDVYGDFPEFDQCLCGLNPGVPCNYRLSHGTPHLHPFTGGFQGYFGAMVGAVRAEISRGEGIYFCATTYHNNTCVNLNFDLVMRRDFNYEEGYLYIKLVKPDEMITQIGQPPGSCALTPPNINALFLQSLATIHVDDYQQYNGTNNFLIQHINFSFFPEDNVVLTDPIHNLKYYNLWFYYQGGPNGNDQLMGIDNVELSLAYTDPPICEEFLYLYDYDAPIEGEYLAEKLINIYSLSNLYVETTATFTAGQQIIIDPSSVSTNLTEEEDYVLFCVQPVECSPCQGYNPPSPLAFGVTLSKDRIDADKDFSKLNNDISDTSRANYIEQDDHGLKLLNPSFNQVLIFNVLGQIVYKTDKENTNDSEIINNLLPFNLYYKLIKNSDGTISSKAIIMGTR